MKEVRQMRERWKLDNTIQTATAREKIEYYLIKEKQVWRFYFRVIKEWFTPCDKCQEKIEKLLNDIHLSDTNTIRSVPHIAFTYLCNECQKKAKGLANDADIILGNKDYEPPLELSRKWDLSDEKNPETIDLDKSQYDLLLQNYGQTLYSLPTFIERMRDKPTGLAGDP
jgi:hypothetical protein